GLAGEVPRIAELAALPELHRLTQLSLHGKAPSWQNIPPPAAALAALAKCNSLTGLRKLHLHQNLLDDDGACALAAAPWLATIEDLAISENPELGGRGFAALCSR